MGSIQKDASLKLNGVYPKRMKDVSLKLGGSIPKGCMSNTWWVSPKWDVSLKLDGVYPKWDVSLKLDGVYPKKDVP
jgi:hypothetical protein